MGDAFTTTVTTETIDYDLDDAKLGEPVATAIRDAIADGIRGITEMSRDGKHRLFNRTGALVEGLHVEREGATFAVLPPADHFQGPNGDALMERLAELVPAIADPTSAPRVVATIEKSIEMAVKPGPTTSETL